MVVFLGDGVISEGDVYEVFNFVVVFIILCVFYVQNNQWVILMLVFRQIVVLFIVYKVIGYGMLGIWVDGNDVLVCYVVMVEVVVWVWVGDGLMLIEVVIYCFGLYIIVDDLIWYCSQEEVDCWVMLDLILCYCIYL